MYRKIIFLLLFVYCSVSCFSQTIEYKLSKDSVLESLTDRAQNFEKGQKLKCNKDTVEFYVTEEETKEYRLLLFPLICENYKNLIGYDTNLELADSIKIFENKYIDLIPEYYLDILKKRILLSYINISQNGIHTRKIIKTLKEKDLKKDFGQKRFK